MKRGEQQLVTHAWTHWLFDTYGMELLMEHMCIMMLAKKAANGM